MTAAAELLAELRAACIELEPVNGGGLRVQPASRLTPELRAAIGLHKSDLLALLLRPAGPLSSIARAMPADARTLLDCLLWLQPDAGSLSARALALATGWPLGMVLSNLDGLRAVGLVARSGMNFAAVPSLMRELSHT